MNEKTRKVVESQVESLRAWIGRLDEQIRTEREQLAEDEGRRGELAATLMALLDDLGAAEEGK